MANRTKTGSLRGCRCGPNTLDVGCGMRPIEGADGIDTGDFGQKYRCDIDTETWPIADCTYDGIHAWNIFEHIRNKVHVINEAYRVLKPGGIIEVVVPDVSRKIELAVADPTHVSFWVLGTFNDYFTGHRPSSSDYGIKHWEIVESRHYDEVNSDLIIVWMKKPNAQT